MPLAGWLGPLEWAVLNAVRRRGLTRFRLRDVYSELRVSPPRAHDALRRLIARGVVRRVSRGCYELADPSALSLEIRALPNSLWVVVVRLGGPKRGRR